jgi:hypothetical protein
MFWFKLMFSVGMFCLCLFAFVVEAQEADYLWASINMVLALIWLWVLITLGRD